MTQVYFDNASTTKPSDEVIDFLSENLRDCYGNPSSLHELGLKAELKMQKAQSRVLKALGANDGKIYFTSGGTEANNLAVMGTVFLKQKRGKKIVVSQMEHSSVLDTCRHLKESGFEVTELAPDINGFIDLESIKEAVTPDTIFFSMMLVNNEVGAFEPVKEAVKIIKNQAPNAIIHTDAVQAYGKIPFKVSDLGIDLMSFSGHKIHAPKGIGGLYVAKNVKISPILFGGEQQDKIRPGTESVPLTCAFGLASEIAQKNLKANYEKVKEIKTYLAENVLKLPGVVLNGKLEDSSPYLLNISVLGYKSETLLHFLSDRGIYLSSGSACQKGAASHVLISMGLNKERVDSALRLSFSDDNTLDDAKYFIETLKLGIENLRHK